MYNYGQNCGCDKCREYNDKDCNCGKFDCDRDWCDCDRDFDYGKQDCGCKKRCCECGQRDWHDCDCRKKPDFDKCECDRKPDFDDCRCEKKQCCRCRCNFCGLFNCFCR